MIRFFIVTYIFVMIIKNIFSSVNFNFLPFYKREERIYNGALLINSHVLVTLYLYYMMSMLMNVDFAMNLTKISLVILTVFLLRKVLFSYRPKKSREIYDLIFTHRLLHVFYPENTLPACNDSVTLGWSIEVDISMTSDNILIPFHDIYTKRLLGVGGKVKNKTYDFIKQFNVLDSNEKVPLYQDILDCVNGQVAILTEPKGNVTKRYLKELQKALENYEGKIYFHTKSIKTYFKLRSIWKDNVFFVLNPFRKRFNFIKGKDYKYVTKLQNDARKTYDKNDRHLNFPSPEDFAADVVDEIEKNKVVAGISEEITAISQTISKVFNRSQNRIPDDHWLLTAPIIHRMVISSEFPEHSWEAFLACCKYAEENDCYVTAEIDLTWYMKEVKCYHSDKISDILGQEKSCSTKMNTEDSISFKKFIDYVEENKCKVNFLLDIKDSHLFDRTLEIEIAKILKGFTGNVAIQSFNPFVLDWFRKNEPQYIRGQIGNSLSGLVKYFPIKALPSAINLLLFYKGNQDFVGFDNSNYLYIFLKFNKIIGKRVLIYAFKNEIEKKKMITGIKVDNYVVEDILNHKAWPTYLDRFKN